MPALKTRRDCSSRGSSSAKGAGKAVHVEASAEKTNSPSSHWRASAIKDLGAAALPEGFACLGFFGGLRVLKGLDELRAAGSQAPSCLRRSASRA